MTQIDSYTHSVVVLEHVEVPMPDGCRLAARIWMPADAPAVPVPAILEYIPYRKNDLTAVRDTSMHPYVAGHGYAVVRLDLRGAGESEGLLLDEYLPQELDDGCEAIRWIAGQPWCDGNVGMVGISWGGFNALQVAALQPPALKAVITLCSTDDRYEDDVHYMGGCLLLEQLSWASVMFGRNTLPPDPRHVGDRWRPMWHERLKHSGLWLKDWLLHQRRDEYWKHGSVCEDWRSIRVPVYAVSGWADGYCRSVFRLMENLAVPRKGLIGPWAHKYPHIGEPGPAIGFLQEAVRWWDHWLKGRDTGIMDEPMLRLYMQHGAEPAPWYAQRDGHWVAEPSWPSPNVSLIGYRLGADGRLGAGDDALPAAAVSHRSPLTVGMMAGRWCSYAKPGDQPADQRCEDAGSLCFETAPLDVAVEIAGDARLTLDLSVDRPLAQVAARLVDVDADGAATRVTYGVLNLSHRNGHETPEPLEPGRRYRVTVPFKPVATRFETGHRIRLALSTSYFPMIWPAPEAVTMIVDTGGCVLDLPVRKASAADGGLAPFAPPQASPPLRCTQLRPPDAHCRVVHELGSNAVEMQVGDGAGTFRIDDWDLTVHNQGFETFRIENDDPTRVSGEVVWEHALSRDDWSIRTVTRTRLAADTTHFQIEARLQAFEGESLAHESNWSERIQRDGL
jgi:hypothetical protein